MDINKIEPPKVVKVEITLTEEDIRDLRSQYSKLTGMAGIEVAPLVFTLVHDLVNATKEEPPKPMFR